MIQAGPLFTDFYQLTMAASYFEHHQNEKATFSLFIRPQKERNYYVMAGLEEAIDELSNLSFSQDEIDYLRNAGSFSDEFLQYLKKFRFTGSVHAMPEGTIFFGNEPVLEVTAPIMEAQLVETFLINTICFQVAVATKASRCFFFC
jgi:nicotinate phosphoribosyltransferase